MILVARGHRLAEQEQVTMEELRDESWIVRAEAHPVVEVLQRSAHEAGSNRPSDSWPTTTRKPRPWSACAWAWPWSPRPQSPCSTPTCECSASAPTPRCALLLAQRQDKVYAPAEVAFHSTLLEVARERADDYL